MSFFNIKPLPEGVELPEGVVAIVGDFTEFERARHEKRPINWKAFCVVTDTPRVWMRFYGGPWHGQMRQVRADDNGQPRAMWQALLQPSPLEGPEFGQYALRRPPTGYRYEYLGADQPSWGPRHELDSLDHYTRGHRDQLDQLGGSFATREEWIWVWPPNVCPNTTVAEWIQVLHADVPYPILGRRPEHTIGASL